MPAQPWVTNRYITATRENFTRAATVGNDVDAVLVDRGPSDARIAALATYFTPKNAAYQAKFGQLDAAAGTKEGASAGLKQMIEGMRAKARLWKKQIGNVFDEGTEQYITLLPHGIGPFTDGKQSSILQAIEGLGSRLAGILPLTDTKADVDATYAALQNKNLFQKGKVGNRDAVSDELENERIALCQALLYVEGGLTQIFTDSPEEIDAFFPIALLRRTEQHDFTGSVPGYDKTFIVQRTLEPDALVVFTNDGVSPLVFYFAAAKGAAPDPEQPVQPMPPGAYVTVQAEILGASAINKFLMVKNETDAEGHWRVEL